ncbi:PIN domain-containing protein [Spongisporangium articulatum]|uniref:PIN domain-containing protein n=1 Tax=Spongisporangium articulatum TaxID=3362603 RepID=A0ABW8AND6_9ACTN
MISVRPRVEPDEALQAVANAAAKLTTVNGSHIAYLQWALEQVGLLSNCFDSGDVEQLIMTRRYYAIESAAAWSFAQDTPAPQRLMINHEVASQQRILDGLHRDLRVEFGLWSIMSGHLVLPDTSVFVGHRRTWDKIDWRAMVEAREYEPVIIGIPMAVIRELDRRKRSRDQRWRAAYTLSSIERLFGASKVTEHVPDLPGTKDVRVRVFPSPVAGATAEGDPEILAEAVRLQGRSGRNVKLVTFDTNMAFEARQLDLKPVKLGVADRPDDWLGKQPKNEPPLPEGA